MKTLANMAHGYDLLNATLIDLVVIRLFPAISGVEAAATFVGALLVIWGWRVLARVTA
ncbi:hypothetical protein HNO88_002773 [Novosphingobium chloroacetimidivorans]|uniref:Uncharacterized protein n=1 Tax=Novosphingobium chloroacetimidivorans TaxID=1428314 RepID=A0A7W7NXG4_9SPHN|nr:hypothetical protein [Novosphingobium chloroacetimidivorans]MBB4859444.1 hypothetical protein [Novosphingobium chloroacetimidivorans]